MGLPGWLLCGCWSCQAHSLPLGTHSRPVESSPTWLGSWRSTCHCPLSFVFSLWRSIPGLLSGWRASTITLYHCPHSLPVLLMCRWKAAPLPSSPLGVPWERCRVQWIGGRGFSRGSRQLSSPSLFLLLHLPKCSSSSCSWANSSSEPHVKSFWGQPSLTLLTSVLCPCNYLVVQ